MALMFSRFHPLVLSPSALLASALGAALLAMLATGGAASV